MTPVAWVANDHTELEQWVEHGARMGIMGRCSPWWIGDWLRYGNLRFGERYKRASKITGYDPQTLMNMVWVSTRFNISRRREKLSWSHHAEIATLSDAEQERWLDRIEEDHLSVRCLRLELRREKPKPAGDATDRASRVSEDDVCPVCGARVRGAQLLAEVRPLR